MGSFGRGPVVISCAVTGGLPVDGASAHLPRTPEEIGQAAVDAWRAGAAIVHLHARDDAGEPAWEAELFARSLEVMRGAGCDAVVNLTTSYGGRDPATPDEQRFAPLSLRPDIASFDCGSMNFGDGVFHNSPAFLRRLATEMRATGTKPELEIFDAGMIANAERLAAEGLLEPPLFFQLVLGIAGGTPATPRALLHLVESLPPGAIWSACAIGPAQLPVNVMAAVLGGHVRTGLEDNLLFRRGEPADNGRLVARIRGLLEAQDREIATPDQARELLGLRPRG